MTRNVVFLKAKLSMQLEYIPPPSKEPKKDGEDDEENVTKEDVANLG